MDASRFDALARRAATRATRRGLVIGIAAGLAALTPGHDNAAAKPPGGDGNCRRRGKHAVLVCHNGKPKCVHRRNVAAHLGHGDQLGDCPIDPGQETCAASDGCGEQQCQVNGATCFCRVNAATREIFCGGTAFDALNCEQCPGNTVCVDLAACGGGVGCAAPCG